jgi:hypothetical protein
MKTLGLRFAAGCALLLTACDKGNAAPAPSATPPPPVASAPVPSAPAPSAPAANPCPPGTTKGTGTSEDNCLATGGTRMIEFTWTGKIGERPEFKMKNVSGKPINNVSTTVYLYDKAGKIMAVKKDRRTPGWTGAYKLAADETKTLEMGPLKADVPAGAAAIEAEAQAVSFDTGTFGKDVYWANYDLYAYDRAKGGPK